MNVGQFLSQSKSSGIQVRILAKLTAHRLGLSEAAVWAEPNRVLPETVARRLSSDLDAMVSGKPDAYVFGYMPFLDDHFTIDERVLIPRPETEHLCARVIDEARREKPPAHILDLCCGCGIMGLSLAKAFPHARVWLTDLSPGAVAVTRENAAALGLLDRVQILEGDLWSPLPKDAVFDLIVANPPYVAEDDLIQDSVLDYEPHIALFSPDQGMAHAKQILRELPRRLVPGGRAAMELGHYHQEMLGPWLDVRFAEECIYWWDDPYGVPRFLVYDAPV